MDKTFSMFCKCGKRAIIKVPLDLRKSCKECFYALVESRVHETISQHFLFVPGQKVGICASGGKDSTVLIHLMKLLNERHNYGIQLFLLSVDEGIDGYRNDSIETVRRNSAFYDIPLKIVGYDELYGWTMDKIVKQIGNTNNCTYCGVLRRQALDRGATLLDVDHIVTGHNADDMAETILMNMLRGDFARLKRCTVIKTDTTDSIPRSKPLIFIYEKEIVMYAYYKKLDYFSTECTYSPNAYRGYAREFLKDLESIRPSTILDIIHSGATFLAQGSPKINKDVDAKGNYAIMNCERCGYMSSQRICKACTLLESLNQGLPKVQL